MREDQYDELVLAIYPTLRGFAYTLFEAPLSPVDWGVREFEGRDKNSPTLEAIARLCKTANPDTLVLEDGVTASSKRSDRVQRLLGLIGAMAEVEDIRLVRYSRQVIRETFHHPKITRQEIAQAIATYIPALSYRLPPMRKLWESEDPRLWLFDAASLALTHYARGLDAEPP